jgi:4-amino-4-deoxy-L-arabinose transferase-like glycosyltransferase
MTDLTINAERENTTNWLARLTVADMLFAAVLVVAGIMRLVNLDSLPLSPDEAAQAWQTWAFWQPDTAVILTASPAYFTLTKLLAQITGYSDTTMRLIPALFGMGIVIVPWLGRHWFGTVTALVTSLLLAVSPLQTITSRTVGGDAIALFALLLVVVGYVRYRETESPTLFLATIGLGLASSPLFFSGIVTLLIAWGIQRVIGLEVFAADAPEMRWDGWKTAVFTAILIFFAVSSMVFWNPSGLGAAARQAAVWFGQFIPANNVGIITDPFLALARYEPILITLGLVVIMWASWRTHPQASFCIYWIAAILVLILVQRGAMTNAVLLTLPGFLMIGFFANDLLEETMNSTGWLVGTGTFLVLILALVNLGRYVRRFPFEPEKLENVWMILFAFAFGFTILYFILSWDVKAVYQGALLGVLAFFVYFNWGTGWWLGHHSANDPRERWVTEGTDSDVLFMLPVIEEVAEQAANSLASLDLYASVDSPVLRWYLRDIDGVQFSNTLPVGTNNEVIITPINADVALGSDYLGGDYGFLVSEPETLNTGSQVPLIDSLRWWFFHESNAVAPESRIILWLRADILE